MRRDEVEVIFPDGTIYPPVGIEFDRYEFAQNYKPPLPPQFCDMVTRSQLVEGLILLYQQQQLSISEILASDEVEHIGMSWLGDKIALPEVTTDLRFRCWNALVDQYNLGISPTAATEAERILTAMANAGMTEVKLGEVVGLWLHPSSFINSLPYRAVWWLNQQGIDITYYSGAQGAGYFYQLDL
jgi:hypothetical protein